MNKVDAFKALITSKIRATAHDFAALQIPDEMQSGLDINPDSVKIELKNLPAALNFEVSVEKNEVNSNNLFTSKTGNRYPCWLVGDEKLSDDWLLTENGYPFYHQLYKKIGADLKNPRLLEFGVRTGYSGVVLAKAINGACTYVGIDPNLYLKDGLKMAAKTFEELRNEGFDINSFLIEGFSSSSAIQNSLKFSGPFDIIHIDGEHTYFGKLFDLYIAKNLVSKGGYILVDDFDHHKLVSDSIKMAIHLGWFKSFSYIKTYRGLGILR